MMKVLITGGAGYIGSHTNMLLNSKGVETVVIDDLSDGHEQAVVCGKFIKGDFGDCSLVDKIMKEEKVDAVIHFAAFASVPDSVKRPSRYYRNNVSKMQNLLDMCVENKIKYFVFSSSAATFGSPVYTPMDELHPQEPINPYGMTKLIGEKLLADYERAYGLRYCAFRYFCAAGDSKDSIIGEAHNPETHLIPVMIKAAVSNKPFSVFGTDYDTRDGSCIRDFIHVLDLAEAHFLGLKYIMENDTSDNFNLGSNTGFTVLEMIKALEKVTGKSVPYVLADRREGDPASLVASNEKARKVLGWNPVHSSIEEILLDAWNWENKRKY
ncbi:MAG: UDP-glucose 4-epimerase GalE [Ruminococcaceae bacterium]|nr:UDP-glucose 4-epimerase GalE [Oscillospiraceae bacterium]